jgi:hypothetical protein
LNAKVECYAGSTYPESPRALEWEGQRYTIQVILERRREPRGLGFTVRCIPGERIFDLFYLTETDEWQIQPASSALNHVPHIQS